MLPVVGVGLLLLVIVLLLTVPGSPLAFAETTEQTSIVSSVMLICIALFPTFLCLLLVYAGLLAALYYTGRANRGTSMLLRRTQVKTREITDRTNEAADRAGQWSIRVNTRFARLRPLLTLFDRPDEQEKNQKGNSDDE